MDTPTHLNNKINSIIELHSSGHISEAQDAVQTLIGRYPNESLLYNISGVCYKATGELEMAVTCFERAVTIKPDFADAHYNLGLTLQELNQLEAAVSSYQVTLALQNSYFKAHNNLGIIYKELGQMEDAVKSYDEAIGLQPGFAEAHNNLGTTLQEMGQMDEAVKSYEKALVIKPDYFEVHNNLGNILNFLGQTNEAINSYKQALVINSDYADAHNNIGIIYHEMGQLDEAIKCYEKVIAIDPEHAEGHNNLGVTLNSLTRFHEAINFYEQALAINPHYDEANFNLGVTFYALGQSDEALNSYKQALVINPDYADAYNNIGNILQELGQLDEAFNSYVHALAINPENAEFHRNLASVKNYKKGDTQVIQMQTLLSANKLSQSERKHLCFALAKAYADFGEKDKLFKVLNEGNKLRKEELNYSIEKDLNKHSLFRKMFISNIENLSSYDPLTISPVFIVGMPRSGTTLVEQIISSHHKVHGAGELSALDNLITPIMDDYVTHNNSLSEKSFLSIRQGYSNNLLNFNVSESIITDKMPTNFKNIGFILKAFPEAKIIHLKRDAMAVCWSIYQLYFPDEGMGFPYEMEDLGRFYNSYIEIMAFWHELFPNQIYDISYENLTTNQEEETRKLLEYCELEWDENCLNFHKNKRAVKTASSLQVRDKMYQGSSEVWKKYKVQLKPLINTLGYLS
jgi:tetratricopeptide (TPR) repeat protein